MKRFTSIILALLLTITPLLVHSTPAVAAPKSESRTIAIVFDNSGSMYQAAADPTAWCRATYAMEVFAAMMNDSDTLLVFPMWEIEVDGTKYDQSNPLKVTKAQSSKIRNIFTPMANTTPIETVTSAYNYLLSAKGDEKWLIVLSDGTSFYRNNQDLGANTLSELEAELKTCVSKVNTMFLGIGTNAVQPSEANVKKDNPKNTFISRKADDSSKVLSYLTEMCNIIFGRDTLPLNDGGKNAKFDVSMKKLIIFVQGEGISNVTLGSLKPSAQTAVKYGEKGEGYYYKDQFRTDKSLQGMLVTFNDVDAGTYEIKYSGKASTVVAYYEPDVDLVATIKDANGKVVDPASEMNSGKYTIEYTMVDKNSKPTSSSLLGKTNYEITYELGGKKQTVKTDKAGSIPLDIKPNDTLKADFKVTYLDGYTIYRAGADFGWPASGLVFPPPPALSLSVNLSGKADSYKLSEFENGTEYRIEFSYDSAPLTGAALDSMHDIKLSLDGGNALCSLERDDNGYFAKISCNNSMLETSPGEYTLNVSGIYKNSDGVDTNTAKASIVFSLLDNSGALAMTLKANEDYYVISDIPESEPFRAELTLNGAPLTDEQLKEVELSCTAEGLKFIQEPVLGESAILVRLDPDFEPESGDYKIKFLAKTKNEIGREVTAASEHDIEVSSIPYWLKVLIPILIILLIIALIIYFLTRKRLPKKLKMGDISFQVRGRHVDTVSEPIKFTGAGKYRGSFTVATPDYDDPRASMGLMVSVEAVSPRYKPSSKRKMKVTGIGLTDMEGINGYTIDGNNFTYDRHTQNYVASGALPEDPFEPFIMAGDFDVSIARRANGYSSALDCRVDIN